MCDLLVDTKHYVLNKSTRLVCGLLWSLCSRLAFKAVEQIQRRSSGGNRGGEYINVVFVFQTLDMHSSARKRQKHHEYHNATKDSRGFI